MQLFVYDEGELLSAEQMEDKSVKIYTIIGGVNGAGKSSFTGALKSERKDLGVIIDVDKITAAVGGNAIKGGKIAITRIDECLSRGVCFTQETTLSGQKTLHTIERARKAGYLIRLYYIGLDTLQECIKRIDNRVFKGGHNIPRSDVIRRFESRFSSLLRVLPYCDEAVFFDNDNGFVEVAEYDNGEVIPKGDYRPIWLSDLRMEIIQRMNKS